MALFLAPRFMPAHQAPQCNPFGFCAPASQPAYPYRVSRPQPRRFAYPSLSHFFTEVDELLSGINREAQRQAQIEAQREAHRQRQQRKHAFRATFAVSQNETGWLLNGHVYGFEQNNINIEVLDEHTISVAGHTEWRSEAQPLPEVSAEQQLIEGPHNDETSNAAPVEAETPSTTKVTETESVRPATPSSDTESHKSYQAFVEDDFEDLTAEASSLFSPPPSTSTSAEAKEPKGKKEAVEESVSTESAITEQSGAEAIIKQEQQPTTVEEERPRGLFEQTFRFPEPIDVNNVNASFKDGVLMVTVPKAQAPRIRKIVLM